MKRGPKDFPEASLLGSHRPNRRGLAHAPRLFFTFFTFFRREGAYKRREGGASRRGLSSPLFLTVTVRPCS